MSRNVLHVENVTMQFGGVVAVNNLSMDINEGEIVALIGPNGAGKTTAFNCITGVYEPTNGRVDFMGKTIVETDVSSDSIYYSARVYCGVCDKFMVKMGCLGLLQYPF